MHTCMILFWMQRTRSRVGDSSLVLIHDTPKRLTRCVNRNGEGTETCGTVSKCLELGSSCDY